MKLAEQNVNFVNGCGGNILKMKKKKRKAQKDLSSGSKTADKTRL